MSQDVLTVTIPGPMRGKQRPRMSVRGGHARAYTPKETVNTEAWVRGCAVEQVGQPVLEGPLAVRLEIRSEVPASWSKRKRADALEGLLRPTGKPDLDNCLKLVSDALNGILWRDDAQIVSATVKKMYAERSSTLLEVRTA